VPKQGKEKSRVRGKYVSVERIQEMEGGKSVEWRMATSSDAGGEWLFFRLQSLPIISCTWGMYLVSAALLTDHRQDPSVSH
jgi:hypothetical protein